MKSVLVVVATDLEARALPDLPGARLVVSGVGAVNAALGVALAAAGERPELIVNVGIGGAYSRGGLRPLDLAVSREMIFAGLGAEDGAGFLGLSQLGFPLLMTPDGPLFNALPAAPVAADFAQAVGAAFGPCLTLETVTGSVETAERLQTRWPGALCEGMEGAGVGLAGARLGIPTLEFRIISNLVGPRDRSAWRISEALGVLGGALRAGWSVLHGA